MSRTAVLQRRQTDLEEVVAQVVLSDDSAKGPGIAEVPIQKHLIDVSGAEQRDPETANRDEDAMAPTMFGFGSGFGSGSGRGTGSGGAVAHCATALIG